MGEKSKTGEIMKSQSFDSIPGYLKGHINQWGWKTEEIDAWIRKPVPMLDNISILAALENGLEDKVLEVLQRMDEYYMPGKETP